MTGPTRPWRIATRRSGLAQIQAQSVADALTRATSRPAELVPLATTGDDHPDRAIEAFEAKGLFVDGTRAAVLERDCDVVVHSYKDLPTESLPELVIGAVPARVDPRDALVTRDGWSLAAIPRDRAVAIGTSSPRRASQLMRHRRDLLIQPLRGNITTRLRKVADGELDGVVIALAGLLRLKPQVDGLTATPLEHGEVLHAPAQGALAVECRRDDAATREALAMIDHAVTHTEVSAEREMLTQLEGGCTAPIGAHAEIRRTSTGDERLVLLGLLADPTGTKMYRASHEVAADEAIMLGRAMAATLLETGGEAVLAAMRSAGGDRR